MKKRSERNVTRNSQKKKSSMHSHAHKSRCLMQTHPAIQNCHPLQSNSTHWYHQKKRAKQRLKSISNGKIRLVTDPRYPQMYYGHHIRHYLVDMETEHIFKASLREVALTGADRINPFTNSPIDLDHYGSLGAIQEHVHGLSMGNIEFLPDNELGEVTDLYEIACLIHHCRLNITFAEFLSDPLGACSFCKF